jgi:DNA repair protein RadC
MNRLSWNPELTSILLNRRYAVIGWNLVSLGTLTESIAHPREVLRPAVANDSSRPNLQSLQEAAPAI